MERDKLFFDPVWLLPWITHLMVGNFKDNFTCKESRILSSNSEVKQRLWDRSVNYVSSQTTYVISTDMAVSSADFTVFFQNKGKSIKRGKNHLKSGHIESCSSLKGELVILVVRGGKMSWWQLRNWCCSLYNSVISQANTSTIWRQTDFLHMKNHQII